MVSKGGVRLTARCMADNVHELRGSQGCWLLDWGQGEGVSNALSFYVTAVRRTGTEYSGAM